MYKTIVLPVLLYGSETWAVTQADVQRLNVFHLRCLRRLLGITRLDKWAAKAICDKCLVKQVPEYLTASRLRWLGHMERMSDWEYSKLILHGTLPG